MESKFIGDSCNDYNPNENFYVRVPFNIEVGDQTFVDDENLNIEEMYSKMEQTETGIKTSCPAPSLFYDQFEADKNNYVVCISSEVSGCYNSAELAKKMFLEDHPDAHIHVFNALTVACGENNIMLKCKELADQGLPFNEVVNQTEEFIHNLLSFSIFTQYDNLVKNGRVKSIIAKGVKFFNIYPILGSNGKGEIVLKHIVKGQKKALLKLFKIIEDSGKDVTKLNLTITAMDCHEKAEKLKELIKEKFNFKNIIIYDALGLSTAYGDRGGIIFSF